MCRAAETVERLDAVAFMGRPAQGLYDESLVYARVTHDGRRSMW